MPNYDCQVKMIYMYTAINNNNTAASTDTNGRSFNPSICDASGVCWESAGLTSSPTLMFLRAQV